MNLKKMFLATIVSFVIMFGLAGLAHLFILKNWYMVHQGEAGNINRTQPFLLSIAMGNLLLAFIMSYLYPKGVESNYEFVEGFKFGAIMGIVRTAPFALVLYGATTVISGETVLVNTLVQILIQGIGGIGIAYVYGDDAPAWENAKA